MSTVRCYISLLLPACLALASCATVIEGPIDRVRYEGGPGALVFYDTAGVQLPSDHEYVRDERLHLNFIELDKRRSEHVVIARHGEMIQRDTLRRKFGYGWLVPNALTVYPFPAFVGIDLLTSSIYSFSAPRLRLVKGDTLSLASPVTLTLVEAAERRRKAEKMLLKLHTGILTPAVEDLGLPPAYGIVGGYHLGHELWATLGYNYASKLEQRLGAARRVYDTQVHSIEATLQYSPVSYAYLLAGVAFDHLVFQLAAKPDDAETRFGRNVMTGSFGGGVSFGSLFLELRRNLALASIETREGPGHQVQFTHLRAGVSLRFEPLF